ncbi:hypothetical protein L1F30_02065 [Simiduia sp. 21SJ11W-1]|uniref:hypothetical protein n=1 Tax=Simiduia sp. 21SJ11W-1 TaxID=2909669 RepID=UPI00209FC93D|nr:hypothetical protein [Simiduia sp. 21SJ11W-1]UTA48341.1 hypothetical protein L1F30_02065 [Simiduia sp. 21SJ11W-1]
MLYKLDLELLRKKQKLIFFATCAMWTVLFGLAFIWGALFVLVLALPRLIWSIYKKSKELDCIENNYKLASHIMINKDHLFYSKGEGSYQVELPYEDIQSVSLSSIFGFNRLRIQLSGARQLDIWNIEGSAELCEKLNGM